MISTQIVKHICSFLKHTGKKIKFNIISVQHQAEGTECRLFAIAFAVALGFGLNPEKLLFQQEKIRENLIACLEEKKNKCDW